VARGSGLGAVSPRGRDARLAPRTDAARRAALRAAFDEHHAAVYRLAFRLTGDAQDAEDVLQTVFVRLANRSGQLGDIANVAGYMRMAATNAALDVLRARVRRPAEALAEEHRSAGVGGEAGLGRWGEARQSSGAAGAGGDGADAGSARAEALELRDRLRAALAGLHPRTAEIFTLRYIEGFGNREIADLLGSTESSVGVSLHRARAQLRRALEADVETAMESTRDDRSAARSAGLDEAPDGAPEVKR